MIIILNVIFFFKFLNVVDVNIETLHRHSLTLLHRRGYTLGLWFGIERSESPTMPLIHTYYELSKF